MGVTSAMAIGNSRSKIKGTFYYTRHFSKMGLGPKIWLVFRKRKGFSGWAQWESCSPGELVIYPVDKNLDSKQKNCFWPWISKILGRHCTFCPSRPIGAQPNSNSIKVPRMFSDMWLPNLLLPPPNIRIFAQKRPNLAKNIHFWSCWAKYRPF